MLIPATGQSIKYKKNPHLNITNIKAEHSISNLGAIFFFFSFLQKSNKVWQSLRITMWKSRNLDWLSGQCLEQNVADATTCLSVIILPLFRYFLIYIEKAHGRKTTQWRKVQCKVSGGRGWKGQWRAAWPELRLYLLCRMSSGQNKKRFLLQLSNLAHKQVRLFPSILASLVKVSTMITRNQTVKNMTIITLLFKYYSVAEEVSSTEPQLWIYYIKLWGAGSKALLHDHHQNFWGFL